MQYWLDLFTGATWKEFLSSGANVTGFRETQWKAVQRIKPGDVMLCYLTGLSRWVGVLEVVSDGYLDETPIWSTDRFPSRVRVKTLIALKPEHGIPIFELRDVLSIFRNLKSPNAWSGHVRGSPVRWKQEDGDAVVRALHEAETKPVTRPVDARKLQRRPRYIDSAIGPVTIPEPELEEPAGLRIRETAEEVVVEPREHEEIQWLLLRLGNDMGLDLWVARNDRGRSYQGSRFDELPRLRRELPLQFDASTNRVIELIDVLWLRGNGIVAAFEVESTTSIYSGLLRMSDLVAMQPNLNIPLYLVAPDERRNKVIMEVNRPTFSRLSPPLNQICRFLSFNSLRAQVNQISAIVRHLKPEFLEDISESCAPEE
jgi:hypothetical protein